MTWIIYLMCLIALVMAGVTVTIAVRHRRLEDANSMDQTLGLASPCLN
jgi:heme/copper-type cytochrome/quinol oxidase subunit 2